MVNASKKGAKKWGVCQTVHGTRAVRSRSEGGAEGWGGGEREVGRIQNEGT